MNPHEKLVDFFIRLNEAIPPEVNAETGHSKHHAFYFMVTPGIPFHNAQGFAQFGCSPTTQLVIQIGNRALYLDDGDFDRPNDQLVRELVYLYRNPEHVDTESMQMEQRT